MSDCFETQLAGGHPNSLGNTEQVVAQVVAEPTKIADLFECYFSTDDVVLLRVSSAFKRITQKHPGWTMAYMDRFQTEIAAIDQASTQWTLAILFDLTREMLSPGQRVRAIEIMQHNIASHGDWIVLNTTMNVLSNWAREDRELVDWLVPHLQRLSVDPRKSVSKKAGKLLASFPLQPISQDGRSSQA